MAILWICISLFFILMFSGSRAVYMKAKGTNLRILNLGDSAIVEWKVLADDRHTDVVSGHLVFNHGIMLLTDYNLDTRTRSNVSVDDSDPNLQFYSSAIGVYGYKITKARLQDAGEYGLTYQEYTGMPGQTADSITVFVYGHPTKPVVSPQTPIMKGHDVSFRCLTESQSEPARLRPEMQIMWTKNGNRISDARYSPEGATLTIHGLDDREQGAIIECQAQENGSMVSARSDQFEVILITIQDVQLSDNEEVEGGSKVQLSWKIHGLVDPPPEYNHSLVFSCNGRDLGEYFLRYRHWEPEASLSDRSTFYSPGAGNFGFILYNTKEEDIGEYICTYKDEFGTSVRSDGLKLKLEGYTFPTFVSTRPTTPLIITVPPAEKQTDKDDTGSQKPAIKPGSTSESTQNNTDKDFTVVIGSVIGAGFGCLFLLLIILLPIILCHRRNKDLKNLMQAAANNNLNSGGTLGATSCGVPATEEDRYSIYNTVRESMMIPETVVIPGPSLPARDTTYNQAFEDTRRMTTKPEAMRQFSMPSAQCNTLPNQDRCQPLDCNQVDNNRRRMVRSLSAGHPDVEENEYLTPISIKSPDVRYINSEPQPSTSGSGSQDRDIYAPQKNTEGGYLEMTRDGSPMRRSHGNAYVTMDKEKAAAAAAAVGDSSEYINIVKAENCKETKPMCSQTIAAET